VIVKALYFDGHITDWQLWDVLGHHQSPIRFTQARQVYQYLGFRPHAGYPLHKLTIILSNPSLANGE